MTETPEERAKRLGLSGNAESAAARARRLGLESPEAAPEPEAGYGERLITTLLKGAQVIPGMKSLEALAASGPVSHTLGHPDTPGLSYTDAREGLEEQTAKLGVGRGLLAQAVASPVTAPLFAMRGISALGPAAKGAAFGGASEAGDFNPNETMTSRAVRTGAGAAAGGAIGSAGGLANAIRKAPSGTLGKVVGSIMPRPVQRGMRTWTAAQKAVASPEIVKPQIRLAEASAPKAEGFVGNSMDNVLEAVKANQRPPLNITRETPIDQSLRSMLERSRETIPHGEALGNQFGDAEVGMGMVPDENAMTLEQQLEESLKHVQKGGTLRSAVNAAPRYAGRPIQSP